MSTTETRAGGRRASLPARFLDAVERVGNRLPDPLTLFVILIGLVLIASWIAARLGAAVAHPQTGEQIVAVDLLSRASIQRILQEMPQTFVSFPPLGLVLVVMLGIGIAEQTGLVAAAMRAFLRGIPPRLVTAAVVLAGLLSSLAVDAGYVVLVPLGAVIFHSMGRHPIAGLAAAFAGVAGGFSANLLITSLDPLLGGLTQAAAQIVDPDYIVEPTANWYLMASLVPALVAAGTFVNDRIVEPRLGEYRGTPEVGAAEENANALTPEVERKGLIAAGAALLFVLLVIAATVLPRDGLLRGPNGEIQPFLSSIVAVMFFFFLLPGLAFGIATGSIRSDRDAARMTAESMASMGAYIALAFVAAHFVAFFNWSNLGILLAITGANALQAAEFTGIPLLLSFVVLTAFVNLFIGSASAKWAVMAPIFVPMFMLLGYSPELTQATYRVGDSFTNIITPLLPYFPLIIIFARRYDRSLGIGSIISTMLPYSIAFGLVTTLILLAWFLAGLPLGPNAPLYYQP
ncbi:MAG: AbgT family transporter [bacterium]|nr:MAG: aminobenzoyl-glutamate transporter [bacterium]